MFLSPYEWEAVVLSLQVAGTAVIFSLPLGIATARVLVRYRFPGKSLLDSVIHLPLVLPPVVIGYLLLLAMGRKGVIGARLYSWFGFSFSFSWHGAALASAVVAFPLMVRAIRLALASVDRRWSRRRARWAPAHCGSLPLPYPCRFPAFWPGRCWPSPARWVNLAPPLPLYPIFPVRRAPSRWRCIP